MHFFNIALLAKWRWRMIFCAGSLWCRVLYDLDMKTLRGVMWVGQLAKNFGGGIFRSCVRKLGEGDKIDMWNHKWVGDFSLAHK